MSIYRKIYYNLCKKGCQLKETYGPGSGLHRHRIVPGHQGGTYAEDNCTYLTPREHVIAHFLLWKINRNPQDLRSMHMLGAQLTIEQRKRIGKWCAENGIGFHNKKYDFKRNEWRQKGLETQKQSGKKDTFYYWSTEKGRKKRASMGGSTTFENKSNKEWLYWMSPEGRKERASMGGRAHTGKKCMYKPGDKSFKRVKPENIEYMLTQGYVFGSPHTPHNKGKRA
jgi:hypothetical protein